MKVKTKPLQQAVRLTHFTVGHFNQYTSKQFNVRVQKIKTLKKKTSIETSMYHVLYYFSKQCGNPSTCFGVRHEICWLGQHTVTWFALGWVSHTGLNRTKAIKNKIKINQDAWRFDSSFSYYAFFWYCIFLCELADKPVFCKYHNTCVCVCFYWQLQQPQLPEASHLCSHQIKTWSFPLSIFPQEQRN